MIRTKHDIDTKLLNLFITEKVFDDEINELLFNWYSSLGNPNHQETRDNAIKFLKQAANKVLTEIDYPNQQREELIKIFEPLELLLRTALPLQTPGSKAYNVRDHLSHTIRNILFSCYLLKRFSPSNYSSLKMQLIIAVIFHDLAYPIEKIKKVAHKLGAATFHNLLDSKGGIEIELNKPDQLLEILNFFGKLISFKESELKGLDNEELKKKTILVNKLTHIYREIVSKAIAGIGLFDSSHSISSVILFLMPIIKKSKDVRSYQDETLLILADICLSMAYHDRGNYIQNITDFPIPLNLRIMRITDELQEWDREQNSYIKDVEIIHDVTTILTMRIIMQNKSDENKCSASLFLPDKVNGLFPTVDKEEVIKLIVLFPELFEKSLINEELKKMEEKIIKEKVQIKYEIVGESIGKKVEIRFEKGSSHLQIS